MTLCLTIGMRTVGRGHVELDAHENSKGSPKARGKLGISIADDDLGHAVDTDYRVKEMVCTPCCVICGVDCCVRCTLGQLVNHNSDGIVTF